MCMEIPGRKLARLSLALLLAVALHADVLPPRPMRPGQLLRRDCEYERRGNANVFCGV